MDEHGGHYAKGNSEITQTKTNTIQYHLYVESKKKKKKSYLIEMVAARCWG